tara:strand:- start:2036 stop:2212 length:177 start_codon:yes stop_codon:yes gene_type:complete
MIKSRVKIAILAASLIAAGAVVRVVSDFRNSPTGKVVEQLQQKKQLIDKYTSPNFINQ